MTPARKRPLENKTECAGGGLLVSRFEYDDSLATSSSPEKEKL
jgi:hypothetical protein